MQFRLYYLSYVSVQVTKVIVEVNAHGSYQSAYLCTVAQENSDTLVSMYSCAQDCSSQIVASSIRGYHPLCHLWCCSLQKYSLLIAEIQCTPICRNTCAQCTPICTEGVLNLRACILLFTSLYNKDHQLFTDLSFRHHRIAKNQN